MQIRAYFKTPIRVFEADEHTAGMKETNIEYLQLTLTPHFSHLSVEMRSTRRRYNGPNYVLKRLIREIHSPAPYDHDAQEVYSGQTDHEAFRRMLK